MCRLLVAVNGLCLRLKDPTYSSAHPRLENGVLRWYDAICVGMMLHMHAGELHVDTTNMYRTCVFHIHNVSENAIDFRMTMVFWFFPVVMYICLIAQTSYKTSNQGFGYML